MLTQIYDLAYEVDEDGGVNLEQDAGCGEVSRITLHPIHVRLLAEEAGILAPSSNIEADRTIARLCRQMRTLHDRINFLDDWLHHQSDDEHADLSYEQTYSMATWEIANEFLKDLPDAAVDRRPDPAENNPENGPLPTGNGPKSGGVATINPPENGAVMAPLGVVAQGSLALKGQQ